MGMVKARRRLETRGSLVGGALGTLDRPAVLVLRRLETLDLPARSSTGPRQEMGVPGVQGVPRGHVMQG